MYYVSRFTLSALHGEAGACRSQAGAVAIARLVDKTPIPVSPGGMTLTRLIGDLQRNMGDRVQQIVEMGLTTPHSRVRTRRIAN